MIKKKKIVKILAVVIVLFLLGKTGLFRPVNNLAQKFLIIPIKQRLYDAKVAGRKSCPVCEIKQTDEMAELKLKVKILEEENKEQKRLLSVPLPKDWQFLTVKVISVGNETLTIDKGKNDGVKEGQTALLGNTFLGKIVTVGDSFAEIRLPTFYDERLVVKITSAKVGEENSVWGKGLLIGRGAGKMKVEQILASERVEKGDLVAVEVDGGTLLIGEVEEIFQTKGDPFKSATVKRLYEPSELNTIFIVRGRL